MDLYYWLIIMKNKPYVALFISIAAVSFASIFIVSIQEDVPSLSIALYRLLFTTLLVLPFVLLHKKTRDELRNLQRSTLLIMVGIGLILAAHFALWITSLGLTSIASSVILVTAHPVLVGPISHFFLKERLSYINSIGITISIVGVIILVFGNYGISAMTLEGNILAMLGGVAAGLYILGGRKIRKTVSVGSYAFVVYGVGTIALLFICLSFGSPVYGFSLESYGIILLMAFVAGILGHTLYNWALEHVRASLASVSLLGEPIGSTLLAFAIPGINQTPSHYTIIGGGIILVGIYLTARTLNKNDVA